MPRLTITADHTTSQFTSAGHGLNTGDGAAGLTAVGGTLPAGGALVEGNNYWIIRTGTDTFKVADSNAHALANVALSFSDNGSGVIYLTIGLPYRPPRTAAPMTQVFSADINSQWAATCAQYTSQLPQQALNDGVLQSLVASVANASTRPDFGADDGANVATLWAYCISPGHAFLRAGSANNKIQVAPGTLLQKIANSDGLNPTLVAYTFAGTEEWALSNGDATNPRVDLLQMKIDYHASLGGVAGVVMTVKQGTPGASPTIPDPDAGFVPVGTAVVGHGWTTGGNAPIFGVDTAEANNVVVHDQRMPLGVQSLIVDPVLFKLETAFALADVNTTVRTSSGTNLMWARCPTLTGRLLAVDVNTIQAMSSTARLGRGIGTPLTNPSGVFFGANGFGSNTALGGLVARSRRVDFEGNHVAAAGPTIGASSVNKIGVPLWASGYRTPQVPNGGVPQSIYLRIQNIANGSNVDEITFYVAG